MEALEFLAMLWAFFMGFIIGLASGFVIFLRMAKKKIRDIFDMIAGRTDE